MTLVETLTTSPAFSAVVILTLLSLLPRIWSYVTGFYALPSIPCVGLEGGTGFSSFWKAKKRFVLDAKSLLVEGYQKYGRGGGVFKLWTPNGFGVAVAPGLVSEIKNAPGSVLDFHNSVIDHIAGKYTGLQHLPILAKCIRQDLTRNHGRKLPIMAIEAEYAFSTHFGQEWTSFQLHPKVLQIVATISSCVFIGTPRNRDPEWLNVAVMFTVDVFNGSRTLRSLPLPKFLYPVTARFIPQIRRTHLHRAAAQKIISPIVQARLEGTEEPGDDMLQWIMDSSHTAEGKHPHMIARHVLQISLVSIHTTALTLTKVLFDLACRQEYMQPLREEAEKVLEEEGGVFTLQAVRKLDLFDSFVKESQRLSPAGQVAMLRRVVSPDGFTFSTGAHLPYGSTILGVTTAAASMDPEIFENPNEFDGYRFQRLRSGEDWNKYTFSSTETLHWGIGKYACPGRFFASSEIKLLLASIVLKYDVRTKDGQRPKDICWELSMSPDPTASIEFRKRR
ncbi:cytochrome P450 [Wilcoxina mikolae CBS 423.85]|nr:cytochrome P450 [Wilcoxina mikolae CBS 423.85]